MRVWGGGGPRVGWTATGVFVGGEAGVSGKSNSGDRPQAASRANAARASPCRLGGGRRSDMVLLGKPGKEAAAVIAQFGPLQQIRAALLRPAQGLLPPPAGHLGMVARAQHRRHLPGTEDRRAGVVWPLPQPAGVGIALGSTLVA